MDTPLKPGHPFEQTIAPGETHVFRVDADKGAFADLRVFQGPVDLVVEVKRAGGESVTEIDAHEYGPEIVCWTAETKGPYYVFVQAKSQAITPAPYRICLTVRERSAQDATRILASERGTEAKRLLLKRDEESLSQALRLYQRTQHAWKQLGETDLEAAALVSIALICFGQQKLREAETQFRAALVLFRRLRDRFGEAVMLANLGTVLCQLGQPEAFSVLTDALEKLRGFGVSRHIASALNSLAMLYTETGEWNAALHHYVEARSHAQGAGDTSGLAYIANNMGVIFLSLGERQKAEENLETAAALFAGLNAVPQEGRVLVRLGQASLLSSYWQEALDFADRAKRLVRSCGDLRLEGDLLRLYGAIAGQSGRSYEAIKLYLQSAEAHRRAGSRSGEAEALHHAGLAWHSVGSPSQAMDLLKQALELRREARLRDGEAATLYAMGRIEAELDRFSDALLLAEQAVAIIEELRTRALGPELRSSYFATRQHYCHFLIHVLMELDRLGETGVSERAFNVSERGRARSLVELLSESGVEIRSGVDSSLLEEERRMTRRMTLLSRRLSSESLTDPGISRQSAENEIEKLQSERQAIEERIRAASPAYASLVRPRPLDLSSVQESILDEETSLIQFALGEPCSYVWIAGKHDLQCFRVAPRTQIEDAARRAHKWLREPRKVSEEGGPKMQDSPIDELSTIIIEPIATSLRSPRLLIAAQGWLQYVPFAALCKPGSRNTLGEEHEIVYVPSVSAIAALRDQRATKQTARNHRLYVLADPVFQATGSATTERMPYIRPIPFSRLEANTIRDLASEGATLAVGFDANREELQTRDLRQYRIIHFGTHAFIDDKYPELSSMALSRFRRDGARIDGLFRLPEVYNLDLDAELVVLAACSSALGKDIQGEGLVGLVRAFMYAGASSVLATLWDVDDRATAYFMQHFYESLLRHNAGPPEALKIAQTRLATHRRWRWPHFWAGFVLLGDWRREMTH